MKNASSQILCRIAWIGLLLVLVVDAVMSLRTGKGWGLGLVVLVLFSTGAAVVALVLMPRPAAHLLGNRDLFVPLALFTLGGKLLGWFSALPLIGSLLTPSTSLKLLNLSFGLSVGFLLHIALGVTYATWMTRLLLDFVRTGQGDPRGSFPTGWMQLWRVLGLEFIGWAAVMVGTALMAALMPILMFFALLPMAVFGVAWNLATAATLPVALEAHGGIWRSFRAGMNVSWQNRRRWWLLVVAQMLLLGFVFLFVGNSKFNFNINVFWTGGYEHDCRWYAKLAETFGTPTIPVFETLLALVFGAFAVAMKLTIIQRLVTPPPPLGVATHGVPPDGDGPPAEPGIRPGPSVDAEPPLPGSAES